LSSQKLAWPASRSIRAVRDRLRSMSKKPPEDGQSVLQLANSLLGIHRQDSSPRFQLVHGPSAESLLSLGEPEPFLYRLTTCVPRMPFRPPWRAGGDHSPTGGAARARDTARAPARALLCRDAPLSGPYPARQRHLLAGSPPISRLGWELRESSAHRSGYFGDAIGGSSSGHRNRLPGKWTTRIRVIRALSAPALRTAPTAGRRVFHRDAARGSRSD
jgi:hypothetical protein